LTRIFWIRHGEVEAGWTERLYGDLDVPLSAEGRRQGGRAAARLAEVALEAVVSSGLARSRHTAELLAGTHGLPVTLERDFREIDRGLWRGKTWDEVEKEFPRARRRFVEEPEYREHGGESLAAVAERVMGGLRRLLARHPSGTIAVVAHLWPIRCVGASILGMPLSKVDRLALDPGAISITEHGPEGDTILAWNLSEGIRGAGGGGSGS
jgi:probable phosphoglycerate mutase